MSTDAVLFQRCVRFNAAVARAQIRAMGMVAENAMRERRGESPAYTEDSFLLVIFEEGIGYNAAIRETAT
jgi:hypothetical protein